MDVSPIRYWTAFLMVWIPAIAITWYSISFFRDGLYDGFTWIAVTKVAAAGFLTVILWLNIGFRWWIPIGKPRPGHCQKCDYDLTGNVSGTCPECGNLIGPTDR